MTELLSGLQRLDVPLELTAAVRSAVSEAVSEAVTSSNEGLRDGEISGDSPARSVGADLRAIRPVFERALGDLSRLRVPEILDDLVLDPSRLSGSRTAALLSGLPRFPAPQVLDRLVGEELESPARHRVERFIGDLDRENVPYALDEKPIRLMGSRIKGSNLRLLVAPLTAIAAGLILWANFGGGVPAPQAAEYSFDVVRVNSPEQLSPLAHSFLTGMTGGSRLRPKSDGGGSPQ